MRTKHVATLFICLVHASMLPGQACMCQAFNSIGQAPLSSPCTSNILSCFSTTHNHIGHIYKLHIPSHSLSTITLDTSTRYTFPLLPSLQQSHWTHRHVTCSLSFPLSNNHIGHIDMLHVPSPSLSPAITLDTLTCYMFPLSLSLSLSPAITLGTPLSYLQCNTPLTQYTFPHQ